MTSQITTGTGDQLTFDPKLWTGRYLFYSHISKFLFDVGPECEKVDPGPPPEGYPQSEIAEVVRKRRLVDGDPARRTRIFAQDSDFPEFLEAFGLNWKMAEDKFAWVHAATFRIPVELGRPV